MSIACWANGPVRSPAWNHRAPLGVAKTALRLSSIMDMIDAAFRLLVATAAGMALGLNRDLAGKPLGTRTLGLVAMCSALIALAVMRIPEFSQSPEALARVVSSA